MASGPDSASAAGAGIAALRDSAVLCPVCGLRQRLPPLRKGETVHCARCQQRLLGWHPAARSRAMAFASAALILYLPANLYPILQMTYLGRYTENTIWSGVLELQRNGMGAVALLVFLSSMVLPLLKILLTFYLAGVTRWPELAARTRRCNSALYHFLERIGPWSMLDVFLVAILIALVKVGDLAHMEPGPGIVAFAAVVLLTLLATQSFDAGYATRAAVPEDDPGRAHG